MKALVLTAFRELQIQHLPLRQIAPTEILIKVHSCCICGSDTLAYLGKSDKRKPPLILGHELSGTIVEVGSAIISHSLGDRVTVQGIISCARCEYCLNNQGHLCPARKFVGVHLPGGFAEYIIVPAQNAFAIPASLDNCTAALAETLACSLHIFNKLHNFHPMSVVVLGAGIQGIFSMQLAKLNGARKVIITDLNQKRLDLAHRLGADLCLKVDAVDVVQAVHAFSEGRGVDVVIDAVAVPQTLTLITRLLRSGGEGIILGIHAWESKFHVLDMINRELQITGSLGYTPGEFQRSIELLASKKVNTENFIFQAPLEDAKHLFEELITPTTKKLKVALIPHA